MSIQPINLNCDHNYCNIQSDLANYIIFSVTSSFSIDLSNGPSYYLYYIFPEDKYEFSVHLITDENSYVDIIFPSGYDEVSRTFFGIYSSSNTIRWIVVTKVE